MTVLTAISSPFQPENYFILTSIIFTFPMNSESGEGERGEWEGEWKSEGRTSVDIANDS